MKKTENSVMNALKISIRNLKFTVGRFIFISIAFVNFQCSVGFGI